MVKFRAPHWRVLAGVVGLFLSRATIYADLAMETETARVLEPGQFEIGTAFEFQTSPLGQEYAVPMAVEFGLFHHLEVLIEPVAYTSIHPKGAASATDIGDLETTLTYLVLEEKRILPAVAFAGEVKFPTTQNAQIGSGEYDYRIYAIASKRFGDVDLHLNVGYNIIGAPAGQQTRNPVDCEVGAEWFIHPRFDLFAEVNYVGSSATNGGEGVATPRAPRDTSDSGASAPEIAAEELVGSIGVRVHLSRRVDTFGSFSYDNNDAKLFRTGITVKY